MMPIPNRDAVALSARTLGALFSYAPNSAHIAAAGRRLPGRQLAATVALPGNRPTGVSLCRVDGRVITGSLATPVYRPVGPAGAAMGIRLAG